MLPYLELLELALGEESTDARLHLDDLAVTTGREENR